MLTHSQPPACRFMYSPGMGNGNYSGNPMQSYNYFPIDFNMPPSLLFRSGQHEIVSAADNSAAVAAAAHFAGSTPLDYSGSIQHSASSQSVHTSMESINGGCGGNDDISSVISAQSSPEYMSPEYGSTLQLQQQHQRNNQQQQYYQQTSMQVDESGAPNTPTAWNTPSMMLQQQMSTCEPTTPQIEMELMKKDPCVVGAKLHKKLHPKIKCESTQQLQSTDHSIGMNIVILLLTFVLFLSVSFYLH